MEEKDKYFMSLALKEAEKAYEAQEVPIGAILVKDNEVVAKAYNKKESLNDATAHAEILVIKEGGRKLKTWRLSGCHLYVTIEPCPMCAGAIIQGRIDRLVFGPFDDKAWGGLDSRIVLQNPALNHQVELKSGVKEEECKRLIKKFFQDLRTKN